MATRERWSYEETTADDKHKRVEVRKISNGFIAETYVSWEDKKKGYMSEREETYYEKNPIESLGKNKDVKKNGKTVQGAETMAGLRKLIG